MVSGMKLWKELVGRSGQRRNDRSAVPTGGGKNRPGTVHRFALGAPTLDHADEVQLVATP